MRTKIPLYNNSGTNILELHSVQTVFLTFFYLTPFLNFQKSNILVAFHSQSINKKNLLFHFYNRL